MPAWKPMETASRTLGSERDADGKPGCGDGEGYGVCQVAGDAERMRGRRAVAAGVRGGPFFQAR